MAVLRDLNGTREYPLRGKITLLGRDPTCDIVVNNERTSWRHALIFHSGQGYAIEDLDSVNGTFVNGRRIQQRTPLQPRDRIEIAGLVVSLQEDAPPAATTTPADAWSVESSPATSVPSSSNVIPDLQAPIETDDLPILTSLEVGGAGRLEVRPEAKLRAILEISQALSNTLQLNEALPRVLDRLFSIFPHADRGFILLRDSNTGQFSCKAVRNRLEGPAGPSSSLPTSSDELPLSQGIFTHALNTGRAILSADASHDARFDPYQSIHRFRIGSIMCVPIVAQGGERLGVIQIDTRDKKHPFCEEDLEVLIAATTMTARAVELARWHREQTDLEAAIRIQKSLLPPGRPQIEGLNFFDYYAAAKLIGGDYFDYVPLPGNRLAVALGDVSGKGISAALLMARLSAAVRFSLATEPSLPAAFRCLNNLMMRIDADRFITFVVAVIDLNDFAVTLASAGHPPILCRRASGEVSEIGEAEAGLPLGVFDRPYEEVRLQLHPGDSLVLYTDGITEARNPSGDFYGSDRLEALVQAAPAEAQGLGEAILADVRRFAAGRPQSDDLTLVCVNRLR